MLALTGATDIVSERNSIVQVRVNAIHTCLNCLTMIKLSFLGCTHPFLAENIAWFKAIQCSSLAAYYVKYGFSPIPNRFLQCSKDAFQSEQGVVGIILRKT
jgi:hypothetical protein